MENNMYNNGFYTQPAAPRMQPRNTQPLTDEEINQLMASVNQMSMEISKEELLKAKCTHKFSNGTQATEKQADGLMHCKICGSKWHPAVESEETIENAINTVNDIFQTIKLVYTDAPVELISTYSQLLPLINRLGQMWNAAISCMKKYGANPNDPAYNKVQRPYIGSGFNALGAIMSNPYVAQQPMQPQPQYGYGYNPYAYNGNPMAYGTPQQPMPQAPGVGYMPPQQPQNVVVQAPPVQPEQNTSVPTQPQTATSTQEVQQTKTFNV